MWPLLLETATPNFPLAMAGGLLLSVVQCFYFCALNQFCDPRNPNLSLWWSILGRTETLSEWLPLIMAHDKCAGFYSRLCSSSSVVISYSLLLSEMMGKTICLQYFIYNILRLTHTTACTMLQSSSSIQTRRKLLKTYSALVPVMSHRLQLRWAWVSHILFIYLQSIISACI